MNKLTRFSLIALSGLSSLYAETDSNEPTPQLGAVQFTNGDQLTGQLLHMSNESLTFRSPRIKEAQTKFPTKSLLSITLPPTQLKASQRAHIATLQMSDRIGSPNKHDQIKGEILDITETHVVLDTDFAGKLNVDKSLVKTISIAQPTQLIYHGPQSKDEWVSLQEASPWTYSPYKLASPGTYNSSVAKDLQLPDRAFLEFSTKSDSVPSFDLFFYSDDSTSTHPNNYYKLQLRHRDISMSYISPKRRYMNLRQKLNTRCKLHKTLNKFSVYMSKEKGEFHVFVNGAYLDTFINDKPKNKKLGTCVHLVDSTGSALEFRDIKLSEWNGSPPIPSDRNQEQHLTGEGELLHLSNGDMLRGVLGEIKDGAIAVKTELATFQVPLSGIQVLRKVDQLNNQAKQDRHDVKAYFHSEGWLIIDVDHIDETHIHGNNEALGDCKFRLDAFRKIDFQIYDSKLNKIRSRSSKL